MITEYLIQERTFWFDTHIQQLELFLLQIVSPTFPFHLSDCQIVCT